MIDDAWKGEHLIRSASPANDLARPRADMPRHVRMEPTGPRPITVNGVDYPSVEDASRALNVTATYLRRMRRQGRLDTIGNSTRGRPVPVTIRGVTYPSYAAAARALDVAPSAVCIAAQRGRLDVVGLGRGRGTALTVDGKSYRSLSAAARALGLDRSTVRKRYLK